MGARLFEMKYDIREAYIWDKIKNFYLRYKLECSLNPQDVNLFQKRREFIARVLLELSPLMKHQTYSYEEEVRLFDQFIYPGDADDIIAKAEFTKLGGKLKEEDLPDVRIKNGLMIPYKEIKVPLECLKGVVIGPTSNPKLQSQALEVLFRKKGLNIEIKTSSNPFRSM